MTLDQIEPGGSGVVTAVSGEDALTTRILEMGVTPGCAFAVIGTAPLGDPIEVEVRGYRLSLRKSEAALVTVEANE
ncbi:MAG: ferrous iron transport protein A [Planctomycetaceae bacterium]|nr:ferrous iron transport protein A [Planctomycetaceae bacterium]MCP4462657.1 ferrous iron transport protein A [Planctomycetaceae bacterium]